MIEIQLPKEAAISLLADQVRQETESRKKLGQLHMEDTIETMRKEKLREIVDVAVFDIIALLPVTLLTEKSNLAKLVTSSVRGFGKSKKRSELSSFSEKHAKNLIKRARSLFDSNSGSTTYQNN